MTSGLPAVFTLRLSRPGNGLPKTINGIQLQFRRRMDLLKAKRAIEALFENPEVVVLLPLVEDSKILAAELS